VPRNRSATVEADPLYICEETHWIRTEDGPVLIAKGSRLRLSTGIPRGAGWHEDGLDPALVAAHRQAAMQEHAAELRTKLPPPPEPARRVVATKFLSAMHVGTGLRAPRVIQAGDILDSSDPFALAYPDAFTEVIEDEA
jgi:hypothetical protein